MRRAPLIVLKLGGSVLRDEADLTAAVHEVYRHRRRGLRVLAVVSALGGTTDALQQRAQALVTRPRRSAESATASLLATGERAAAALFVLALERAGVPSSLLDPAEVGPGAEGSPLDAHPVDLDTAAIEAALDRNGAAVLPGYIGRDHAGKPTLLGRGGTDLSALFVAERLGAARVRLVKDVAGLYERDPSLPGPPPRRYVSLSWDEALGLGGRILQDKALLFARDMHLPFEVGGLAGEDVTRVGDESPVALPIPRSAPPLRVALAGLGAVGGGLYRELAAHPEHFAVTGVLVRDIAAAREEPGVTGLLTDDPRALLSTKYNVLVELAGGVDPAQSWVRAALGAGRHVVTANKALLAEHGPELARLAASRGVRLCSSASVGGSVPALETARRLARRGDLTGFEGVLGGTANFVLDRLAEGLALSDATDMAREAGLAEADPRLDLDGTDAAQKLTILARAAFGDELPLRWLNREGVTGVTPEDLEQARRTGCSLRLVACCRQTEAGLVAGIKRRVLPRSHDLADVSDEENKIVFELARGETVTVRGLGAGRWPTVESVLADLLDLVRLHQRVELPVRRKRASGGVS